MADSGAKTPLGGENLLYLTDEQLRKGIEAMFFAYRGFTADPDKILENYDYGRAHHRALHFIHRAPGTTVNNLLAILGVTKQSLNRVLRMLIEDGLVESRVGRNDKRERHLHLTPSGTQLERDLSEAQRARMRAAYRAAGPQAVAGFRQVLEAMMEPEMRQIFMAMKEAGEVTEVCAPHLLVVDDDARIRGLLQKFLVRAGFLVSTARDAAHARRLLGGLDFDMIVLDVMMPGDEDGISLTGALREDLDTPILLLTARGDASDRIAGLEAGADDYLTKPFEPKELLLRVNAILRRIPPSRDNPGMPRQIQLGLIRYDVERGEMWRGTEHVRLTATEGALMRIFASHVGEPVTREKLVEDLGRDRGQAQERAVDVQITRLRRKIEADPRQPRYLQTVRGEGYMLAPD